MCGERVFYITRVAYIITMVTFKLEIVSIFFFFFFATTLNKATVHSCPQMSWTLEEGYFLSSRIDLL